MNSCFIANSRTAGRHSLKLHDESSCSCIEVAITDVSVVNVLEIHRYGFWHMGDEIGLGILLPGYDSLHRSPLRASSA